MAHPCTRCFDRFRGDHSGAVAIEFMLIAPILFALLLGIITLGYFVGISHSVSQLATGAARVSVTGLDQAERESLAETYLAQAGSRYPLLATDALTSTVTFDGTDPAGITVKVVYSVDGSLLDVANGFLGLGITNINGSAYLAY
ncbi:TadE/TadG family type IV pilus assembly protein [Pseudorhodobacter sp.]|uniref:TadE/TadG family type IV pilus assembly protein n=1 Tax=Pseudorhodobacter sp. TaxID=1934400 RepID=UPI002647052F|nr:TadE/TadG family type IV pilus assembly protein [Pseudorhodobacter sp.]MDN5785914.1 pilus assembly protein [Pseudorhodobacter sp.]